MILKNFVFKKVNSTNSLAIKIIKKSKTKSGIVIANLQTNGRGQYGKKWISFRGNVFVSIFFSIENLSLSLKQLTKINCLIIKRLLLFYCKKKITIKKPNDLLIDKKKICGILQEKITNNDEKFIIVGIGINLVKSPHLKKYPTTNLLEITKIRFDKKNFIIKLKKMYQNLIPKLPNFNNRLIKKI